MEKRLICIIRLAFQSIWQVSFFHSEVFTLKGKMLQTTGTRKPVMRIVAIQKVMMMDRNFMSAILAMKMTANPAMSAPTAAKFGIHMVLMVSYGSGAGSDAFIWQVTPRIDAVRALAPRTRDLLDQNKIYLEYGAYAKYRRKIRKAE